MPTPDSLTLPSLIARHLEGSAFQQATIGVSGAEVYRVDAVGQPARYLKVASGVAGEEIAAEHERLEWLRGRLPVPNVLAFARDDERAYLLLSEAPGLMACDPASPRPHTTNCSTSFSRRHTAMSPDADPYASIAAWYDLEHDALTDDIALLHELIATRAPSRARALEIGAGTGRIAAGLAMTGMDVTAVEPSAAMRERAAKRLSALPERVGRRVRLVAGSATSLGITAEDRFDAVVFGLGTFAHLTSLPERLDALARARSHLRDDGQLLLDLDLAGLRRLSETPGQLWHQGTWPLPESGSAQRFVSHFIAAGPAREGALVPLTHFYDVYEQGGSVARTTSQMTLALLSRGEVEMALLHTGYAVDAVYGGYAQEPYEEGASRAIFVATPTAAEAAHP